MINVHTGELEYVTCQLIFNVNVSIIMTIKKKTISTVQMTSLKIAGYIFINLAVYLLT